MVVPRVRCKNGHITLHHLQSLVVSLVTVSLSLLFVQSSSGLPRRVQALYDCEADNEDELTFKEGDVILVKGDGEDAEWWVSTFREGWVNAKCARVGGWLSICTLREGG